MNPIDADQRDLHNRGWSCGEFSYFHDEEMMWQVFWNKGAQKVIGRAYGREVAWREALQLISRVS